jgi:tRNA U34 5-methylaminomethyl-2-thiouridine-forming methyltransferase MnmC
VENGGYKLVELANKTHSVHALAYGETMHPAIGPAAEAELLYVHQLKLRERLRPHEKFVIWDVGLGAAANAIAALNATREISSTIQIFSFDNTLEPLRFALQHSEQLGYLTGYEKNLSALSENGSVDFQNENQIVRWKVVASDFPALLRNSDFLSTIPAPDAILFDAFSPKKNPAMWTQEVFVNLFRALDPKRPCSLATYSRSTMVRVALLLAGFFVGAGHSSGQKEETTVAANCLELIEEPLPKTWLERARISISAEPLSEPVYRQARLSEANWEKLKQHPQFS